jgi:hypothetical protein
MSAAESLRAYQAANRQRTVERITAAMQAVEASVTEHGYYPENGGRITRKEVCRRAGLGASTLKNRTHAATAAMVDRWLQRLKTHSPGLKPKAEDARQRQIATLQAQVDRSTQTYNLFKIKYDQLEKRNIELEEENATLRQQLALSSKPIKYG